MSELYTPAFASPTYSICKPAGKMSTWSVYSGAPTASAAGYEPGCIFQDITNAALYYNSGTTASATWVQISSGGTFAALTVTTLTSTTAGITTGNIITLTVSAAASTPVVISDGDGSTAATPKSQVLGANKGAASMLLGSFSATATSAACPSLDFLKSANATVGSNTVVTSGEVVGEINWFGADGTDFKSAAGRIACLVDTTPGTGDMPGRLVFSTTTDNTETLTEAFRVDNAQRIVGGAVAAQTVGGNIGSYQEWGTTAAKSQSVLGCASTTDATQAEFAFVKCGNAAVGSFTTVASGEALGAITWYGDNGTTYANAFCQINAIVDATPGAADAPGRLSFLTTPDGSTTLTESFRIDNAQRVVQGGAAAQTISDGDGSTASIPSHQILGANKATSSLLLGNFSATSTSAACPSLNFLKSANATVGSNTVVVSGGVLGEINFFGADGTDFKSAACRIAAIVDATPGTGDMPGKLVFSTSIDNGETLTTALTINNVQTVTCSKGLVANSSTAAAITTTRALTAADSGGIFSVAKTSAYAITLPTPAQGLRFKFLTLDTGAFAVTFSDGSAHFFGVASVNNVSTAMTGTTLTLAATASIGDWVEFCGIDATHYLVTGACIAAGKITIA